MAHILFCQHFSSYSFHFSSLWVCYVKKVSPEQNHNDNMILHVSEITLKVAAKIAWCNMAFSCEDKRHCTDHCSTKILTFHSITCFRTVRSRHSSSQEVSKWEEARELGRYQNVFGKISDSSETRRIAIHHWPGSRYRFFTNFRWTIISTYLLMLYILFFSLTKTGKRMEKVYYISHVFLACFK